MLLTDIGKLETPSNDQTFNDKGPLGIAKALREELVGDKTTVSKVNHTVNASAWVPYNPLESQDRYHIAIRRLAYGVWEELGDLNSELFLVVKNLLLEKRNSGYLMNAQVTYVKEKSGHSTTTDDDRFVFISKENPDLAIDLIDSDSYGNAIRYYGLVPHDGWLNDIQPLHKSDVKDYDLSRFLAIPVTEDTNLTWKTVLDTISKK